MFLNFAGDYTQVEQAAHRRRAARVTEMRAIIDARDVALYTHEIPRYNWRQIGLTISRYKPFGLV